MNRSLRSISFFALILFALGQIVPIVAQQPSTAPAASHVPEQVHAAKTIFLANKGSQANFPESSEDSYNAVYAALQSWGHFQIVSTPSQADLVLQLHDVAPITDVGGGYNDTAAYAITSPAFRLSILDAHTQALLWTVTSPVNVGHKRGERAKWFAVSVTNLISRLKVVTGEPLTAEETTSLTTEPPRRHAGIYLVLGITAVGVGGGLLLHHLYENSVNKQNQQFCTSAPSLCTGGVPNY